MRSRLRSISPAVVISAVAAAVITGGFAMAAIPSRNGTITACANKKTGALRVVDADKRQKCRRTERRITWNQRGAPGAKGDAGAPGATGPRGDRGNDGAQGAQGNAGTGLSTSDFYNKTESDSRFLGTTGTAADSLLLDGRDASDFVQANNATIRQQNISVGAGDSTSVVGVDPLGGVEVTCSDPATSSTARWRAAAGPVGVWADDGGATPTHSALTAAGASPVIASGVADHITFTVGGGITVAIVDVWVVNGPGGANVCSFLSRVTTVDNG